MPSICPLNLVHSRRFHQRCDDVGEGQERHDQHLEDHPGGTEDGSVLNPSGPCEEGGGHTDKAPDDDAIATDGRCPTGRRIADDHLVPPHLTQVVGTGADPGPFETVTHAVEAGHRVELLDGVRVPDEIEAFAHGVRMVDAVVTQHPALVDVPRGKHCDGADDAVHALAGEEGAVRGIVGDDEQAGDDHARKDPEGDGGERVVEQEKACDDKGVDDKIAAEVGKTLPGRIVVGGGGNDVDDGLERTLAVSALLGCIRGVRIVSGVGFFLSKRGIGGCHGLSLPTGR